MDKMEQREILTQAMEIREDDEGNKTISGYAVKWNKRSHVIGMFRRFREEFRQGAFADSLNTEDQRFLWSHDISQVLGRTKNNTLRLEEDETGLRFELDLPNTTLGKDTYESIKRGDVDGVSFGFRKQNDEWNRDDPESVLRSVTKAKLLEVSAVAFPAYPDSEVSARGYDPMKQHVEELRQYEEQQATKIKLLTIL